MRKQKGSITVFFSLIFTLIVALLCTVAESSKVYASYTRAKSMSYMAVESKMAGYARELFDEYGAFAVWDKDITESISTIAELNNTDNSIEIDSVSIRNKKTVTGNGADDFVRQLTDYEKFEVAEKGVEYIVECFNKYAEANEGIEDSEIDAGKVFSGDNSKIIDEMSDSAKKCEEQIRMLTNKKGSGIKIVNEINQVFDSVKEGYKKEDIEHLKDKKDKLEKYITQMNKRINKVENIGRDYEQRRNKLYSKVLKGAGDDSWDTNKELISGIKSILCTMEEKDLETLKNYINNQREGDIPDLASVHTTITGPLGDKMSEIDKKIEKLILAKDRSGGNSFNKDGSDEDNNKNVKSLYDAAKTIVQNGVLGMVLENVDDLSKNTIILEGLPSKDASGQSKIPSLDNLINKGLFVAYINNNCVFR